MGLPERPERVAAMQALLHLAARAPVAPPSQPRPLPPPPAKTMKHTLLKHLADSKHARGKHVALEPAGEDSHIPTPPLLPSSAAVLEPPGYPGAWSGLRLLQGEVLAVEVSHLKRWLVDELVRNPPYDMLWMKKLGVSAKVSRCR